MIQSDRVPCCVPFCRRTIARDRLPSEHAEWICGRHWPAVPKHHKRRLRQIERIAKRTRRLSSIMLAQRIWERCKREAIERAMGLK